MQDDPNDTPSADDADDFEIEPLSDSVRNAFDERFEIIFESLLEKAPPEIGQQIIEIPIILEDYPGPDVVDAFDLEFADDLCGLHDGVPLTERSVDDPPQIPEEIYLYRMGIMSMATGEDGRIDPVELDNQIRITLIHELGHHFGLTEEDLDRLGYA